MKFVILSLVLVGSTVFADTYQVDGKSFTDKAMAIRYVVASGKKLDITETRCMILTNKLTLKACPKNKASSFETQQFESITQTK